MLKLLLLLINNNSIYIVRVNEDNYVMDYWKMCEDSIPKLSIIEEDEDDKDTDTEFELVENDNYIVQVNDVMMYIF
jgi:hypothetical protein